MSFNKEKKPIVSNHFLSTLFIFIFIIVSVWTFVSFLEDAEKNDKLLNQNSTIEE